MIREGMESLFRKLGGIELRKHPSFWHGVGRAGLLADSCGWYGFKQLQVFATVQVLNV